MKRTLLVVAVVCILAAPSLTHADTAKMGLWLQHVGSAPVAKGPEQGLRPVDGASLMLGKAAQVSGDAALVNCFVKTTDIAATEAAIIDVGGIVNTVLDTILTAAIPAEMLTAISDREEVVTMESSQLLTSKMNFAREPTRVDDVQAGVGVDTAYDGNGVMVGVVDDSLDWEHADFGGTSNTRIRYIRQGTGTSAVTCDRNEILNDTCNVTRFSGLFHGSHVTGIAVGGHTTYTGVATGAWIGFAFNLATDANSDGSFSTSVLDGVSALFDEADTADLPAVVNLSLGTSIGAHDGTSLLEQGLDQSVSGKQGRIIVNAAGNEDADLDGFPLAKQPYVGGIHADINVAAGESRASRFVVWRSTTPGEIARYLMSFTGALVADVWLAQGNNANCKIDVKAYPYDPAAATGFVPTLGDSTNAATVILDENALGNPLPDANGILVADDGTARGDNLNIGISVATDGSDPNNSKPHAIVAIGMPPGSSACSSNPGCARFEEYYYDIIIRETGGATCTGDVWLYPDQPSLLDFIGGATGLESFVMGDGDATHGAGYILDDGDSFKTTTIPGTAIDVVTAGAYLARANYTDINGATESGGSGTVGQTTPFSSLGPTADGRTKPEVIAPGQPIISTLDSTHAVSNAEKGDATHFVLSGTSMASPHVTGIIALMLEKNNCLTTAQVKTAIAAGSNATGLNSYTAAAANTYGAGLIDAVALINAIAANTSCYSGSGFNSGGGGGCGTIVPVTSSGAALPALALLFGPAVIVWLRRRKKRKTK